MMWVFGKYFMSAGYVEPGSASLPTAHLGWFRQPSGQTLLIWRQATTHVVFPLWNRSSLCYFSCSLGGLCSLFLKLKGQHGPGRKYSGVKQDRWGQWQAGRCVPWLEKTAPARFQLTTVINGSWSDVAIPLDVSRETKCLQAISCCLNICDRLKKFKSIMQLKQNIFGEICTSNHHDVYFTYLIILSVNYTSIKLKNSTYY